ncbi:MAG: Fe(2+) transporter permease subunit FeoB [Zoogloeaceae bacterium]|jgi:ferrous iron transport protein B|nr:Fe(2+) transporter permease subunit FeoB [Zoogloeaceae bacterium]
MTTSEHLTIGLVGNPNCGKTTLFNALTGSRQRVGNWPGVTVEKKSGAFTHKGKEVEVVDLPGAYSLDAIGGTSLDEQVARHYVLAHEADLIVNIVDASNLERNLYLTTQLLEMRVPLVLALNMGDVAEAKGMQVDASALARELGCPVLTLVASKGQGVVALKDFLVTETAFAVSEVVPEYPAPVVAAIEALRVKLAPLMAEGTLNAAQMEGIAPQLSSKADCRWIALKALEGDEQATAWASACGVPPQALRTQLEDELNDEMDIIAADARYGFIGKVARAAVTQQNRLNRTASDRIDQVMLNRVLGIPIFLFMMYLMFMFTINLGGAFIDFFDGVAETVFVQGFGHLLQSLGAPLWLEVLLAKGIGGGIQTVASFIPVIGFLFVFLSILEDSGYMARAAFVMDRFMRFIGLPGKSFVPLIVGFGCNVPAVMATRTLESERDRLMTMAMTPFMSCGARLPVYALFAVAFFPTGGQNMVFLLYIIGIVAAVLTGLALKRTLLPGQGTPFIMELPPYHLPTVKNVLIHAWNRLRGFIFKAGRIIVPMVLVLNILNAAGTDGSFGHEDSGDSVLSAIGRQITPVFAPLGLQEDNWPAAVGIFTGVLAKEAVVGTLNALYSQVATEEAGEEVEEEPFDFWAGISAAAASVPEKLGELSDKALDPLGVSVGEVEDMEAAAEAQEVSLGTYGAMAKLFGSSAAAFSYLMLILLYFPCVAVLGAVRQEAGLRWALFMAGWSTAFGYGAAVFCYQFLTFAAHPLASIAWGVGIVAVMATIMTVMGWYARRQRLHLKPVAGRRAEVA